VPKRVSGQFEVEISGRYYSLSLPIPFRGCQRVPSRCVLIDRRWV